MTFFPFSERIERQAFGRAGRKGEKGSGQLFINSQDDYNVLINKRITDEENEFNYLINVYKKRIDLFQELFEEFTEFLNEIRIKKKLDESALLDIKERWGIFLVENDLSKIEQKYKDKNSLIINEQLLKQTRNNFKKFMKNLKKSVENRYEYFNPLLLCKTFEEDRCDEAIEKSPIFCFGAYLFRIFYNIDHHNYFFENKKYFDSLENNCIIFLNQINIYFNMMNELKVKENSDLYKQTLQKHKFFGCLLNLIRYNKKKLSQYIKIQEQNKNLVLTPKVVNLEEISKNAEYNDEILNYFKDYGMCLYNLEYTQKNQNISNCSIF